MIFAVLYFYVNKSAKTPFILLNSIDTNSPFYVASLPLSSNTLALHALLSQFYATHKGPKENLRYFTYIFFFHFSFML